MRPPFVAIAIVATAVALYMVSTTPNRHETDEIISQTGRRTVPSDAFRIAWNDTERSGWSLKASWQFSTRQSWEQYRSWLTASLKPEFKLKEQSDSVAEFAGGTRGDQYMLTAEVVEMQPVLTVRILFRGMAS